MNTLNDNEKKVLDVLVEAYMPDEWGAFNFKNISEVTKFEVKQVRRACRSLAKKGYAAYERTLVNEDGIPAGAGYRATEDGAAYLFPCDICGKRSIYDYEVDEKGEQCFLLKGRRVLECSVHYKQSTKSLVSKQPSLIE